MSVPFESLAELMRTRRTSRIVDNERDVPVEIVQQLCELAQWAPNHRQTWPWRFALFSGAGRARLGQAFAADMTERNFGDEMKRTKIQNQYLRAPAILVVGCSSHPKANTHEENRDAVAAGIQNMLLGATSLGLATFWSTPPLIDSPRALELCGFEPDVRIINVMYLGWATDSPDVPARPPVTLNVIDA